jgi:uncharacterized repeat protein (TIGR01451 family)
LTGLADGSYTLTPAKSGYTFSPTSLSVTVAGANATGKNFTGTLQTPSVTLAKSVADTSGNPISSAASGTTLVYTITYQNQGVGDASSVVLKDVIPTGSTYVAGSAAASAAGVTITQPAAGNGNTITWTIGTVHTTDPVQSVSFKVTVN